jgi:IS30 family transposase
MPGRARLTRDQRGVIEEGLAGDPVVSWVELGRRVGAVATTVAREVRRNRGRSKYSADAAQVRAAQQVRRPKVAKLVGLGPLRDRVNAELKLCRSPVAIALDLAADGGERVCVESIYRAVYAGEMEPKARDCLRRRRVKRRGRQQRHDSKRPGVPNISQRPEAVNDRSELGHLEGDLIIGANNASAVLTVIERVTRHCWLVDLPEGYTAEAVLAGWTELLDQIPAHMRRSLTLDQGSEWAQWETLTATYGLDVWFCDPHSPWQRGAIENLNGHVRFWLPRGTRLDIISPAELDRIAGLINGQRRRILHGHSPAALYTAAC